MEVDEIKAERTINYHKRNIEELSNFLEKPVVRASKQDPGKYLKQYRDYSKSHFTNKVKSLRAFYGRFF